MSTPERPQPVVQGVPPLPTVVAMLTAVIVGLLHRALDGMFPDGDPLFWDAVEYIVGAAVVAAPTWLAARFAAKQAAAVVTPLASPMDDQGRALVPVPAFAKGGLVTHDEPPPPDPGKPTA